MRKRVVGGPSIFEPDARLKELIPRASLKRAMDRFDFPTDMDAMRKSIEKWVEALKAGRLKQETAVEGSFLVKVFEDILGYKGPVEGSSNGYTLYPKKTVSAGGGAADGAIGFFGRVEKADRIVAPIELKGSEADLERPMARGYTPIQQGWRYANETPDCPWVIVSNYRETRLYHSAKTSQKCQRFELERLLEEEEFRRFYFCLCASNLLRETGRAPLEILLEQAAGEEAAITKKFYSSYRAHRETLLQTLSLSNPATNKRRLLEKVQKLLDRALFVAFAEDRGLLPEKIIRTTYQQVIPTFTKWENFQHLFKAIQKGDERFDIPAYNGGLFAEDLDLDILHVPDTVAGVFDSLAAYDFNSQLDVDILGHVFEQSVSDLEALRRKHFMEDEDPKGGRRKKQGIVYTRPFITHFIYERTVGRLLRERFAALEEEHGLGGAYDEEEQRSRGVAFWLAYAAYLESLRICDIACGSGAFLIAAFDALLAEYDRVNKALEGLGERKRWEHPGEEILRRNLFGVDIAPESVEITKLSLWLKTAKKGKKLVDLDSNIRCGNSLVENKKVDPLAVDWRKIFPKVFKEGGFDVILSNPPYVRIQNFASDAPAQAEYFSAHYKAACQNYDLYALFVERGLSLLKHEGVLGYILPNKFFTTEYGQGLRGVITQEKALLEVVDLDRNQAFEGVTTYTALLFLRKDSKSALWWHLPNGTDLPEAIRLLSAGQRPEALPLEASAYGEGPWVFRAGEEGDLLERLKGMRPRLGDISDLFVGLQTSADPVYILEDLGSAGDGFRRLFRQAAIHKGSKDSLPGAEVVLEETFLKPLFKDGYLEPFFLGPPDHRVIFPYDISGPKPALISRERFEKDAPKTWAWLKAHEGLLRMREKGKWNQEGWWAFGRNQNLACLEEPKIVVKVLSDHGSYAVDVSGIYYTGGGTAGHYGVRPKKDSAVSLQYLNAILASSVADYFNSKISSSFRGGYSAHGKASLKDIPIPIGSKKQIAEIEGLSIQIQSLKRQRFETLEAVRRRLRIEVAGSPNAKLSKKLEKWPALSFPELQSELQRLFKKTIPFQDRPAWEREFDKTRSSLATLERAIGKVSHELEQKVFEVYNLSDSEKRVVVGG